MASISCPQCGTPVDSRSPFCGYCGYSMKASEIATSRPPMGSNEEGIPHLTINRHPFQSVTCLRCPHTL